MTQSSLPTRRPQGEKPGFVEFIALMAITMSLMALSIDAMLPAFDPMSADLGLTNPNDIQLVISLLVIGLSLGQPFYGPLSDTTGRKPALYIGYSIFLMGSLLCMVADSFSWMLVGRFLEGFGAAGPRTVAFALVRDRFHGSAMARVMSFIMTVFILVPIIAPALGQVILMFAGWRVIFGSIMALGMLAVTWLAVRQPETWPVERRLPFSLRSARDAFHVVFRQRQTMVYTLVSGCVLGALYGYINSTQQVFQGQYGVGASFPLYFAALAAAIGVATMFNGSMVMRFGMHELTHKALWMFSVSSCAFLAMAWFTAGHPPLWQFMAACFVMFLCIGVTFGNLNAIAMEPLGHVAGTAASVIGSISNLVGVFLGLLIGRAYNGTVVPMAIGFASLSVASLLLTSVSKPR